MGTHNTGLTNAQIDTAFARALNNEALIQSQVKAPAGGILLLTDNDSNGMTVNAGGDVLLSSGNYHVADGMKAKGSSGLLLADSSGNGMTVNPGGNVTNPTQCAFSLAANAEQSLSASIITQVLFGSTLFDVGSNTSGSVFTAPVDGKYQFTTGVRLNDLDVDTLYYRLSLVTSNAEKYQIFDFSQMSGDPAYWTMQISHPMEMDAGDTASVYMYQYGGATQSTLNSSSTSYSWFTGYLVA